MGQWKIHIRVLIYLAIIVLVMSLLFWFHPTLGYAEKESIIAGADLRSAVIQILWILFIIFSVCSSIVFKLIMNSSGKWVWLIAYGTGIMMIVLLFPLIEKYF